MRHLLILRHAEAAPAASGGDVERPLTAKGQHDAVRMGHVLRDAGIPVTKTLVSPARRTRETWRRAEEGFGGPLAGDIVERLYNAGLDALCAVVAGQPAEIASLMLVGHNPGLAEAANFFAGSGAALGEMRRHFPAPCLAVLAFEAPAWDALRSGHLIVFKT